MSRDHVPKSQSASRIVSSHGQAIFPRVSPLHESSRMSGARSLSNAGLPEPSSASYTRSSLVDQGRLGSTGQHFQDSPPAIRQWLEKERLGGNFTGRSVPMNMTGTKDVGSTAATGTSTGYMSMLPILSMWLTQWFDRVLKARRDQRQNRPKKPKNIPMVENDDFDWICKYIIEYLEFAQDEQSVGDIVALVEAALGICGRVVYAADIERPLGVLKAVFSRHRCPDLIFERCLHVLCGILGSVRAHPLHLPECLDLFLSGSDIDTVLQALYKLLQTEHSKLEATTINAVRGAIQLISELIESKRILDRLADDLLTSLLSAARWQKQAVSEVALQLCSRLAERKSCILSSSDEQFSDFMEIVNAACATAKASHPEDISTGPWHSPSAVEAGESHGYPSFKDSIDSFLEELLPSLNSVKQSFVIDRFMHLAPQQPLSRSLKVLAAIREQISNQRSEEGHRDRCLQVIEKLIRQRDLPPELRLAAIDVVEHAVSVWANDGSSRANGDLGGGNKSATTAALQDLSEAIESEANPPILEALIDTVVQAEVDYGSNGHAKQICEILTEVASRGSSEQAAKCSEIGARGLVSMFMWSLNTVDVDRTDVAYRKLIHIASSFQIAAEARLAALRLLLRIRCDSSGRLYVSQSSDSEYFAAALCRTDESAEKFSPFVESPEEKVTPRSSGVSLGRRSRPTPPLWIYPGLPALPFIPDIEPSAYIGAPGTDTTLKQDAGPRKELELSIWLECVISCLQKDPDWETYSYVVVHIGAQLSNVRLLEGVIQHIRFLRSVLCEQVLTTSFHEPPMATGLKKGDVALCVYSALTPLIAYKSHFSRNESDKLVQAFIMGIGSFEGTSRGCIHSLSICCFEMPGSVTKNLSTIVHKIQTNATQSHLSMHFLEFFAGLGRHPQVHTNLRGDEVRLIFGICISYIKSMRDRQSPNMTATVSKNEPPPARSSGIPVPPFRAKILSAVELPQYVTALAYHTMIFWFLSLRLSERAKHVPWITKSLIFVDNDGNEQIEEQSEVFIDMMQRTSFSDLGETVPHPDFASERDGSISTASWLVGLSIVTIETAGATGLSQITKRQASGTTHSIYQQHTAELLSHHVPMAPDIRPETSFPTEILPQHILLQMVTSCAPTGLASQPLPLPDADYVRRAMRAFDLNATVDGTKIGVIYVGPDQSDESEILANTESSAEFVDFLNGLGTKVRLEGAKFNTQGLRAETDGEYTYAWRDRVTEIVYHVPCMMPTNLDDDPQCTNKKRHIGNDHVNIIFNRSGEVFDFDTFGSQFNSVNIVVTPASRIAAWGHAGTTTSSTNPPFYQVHTLSAEGFPALSPASDPKIISAANLAGFVRIVALNASVFSLAWRDRDSPNDHMSSWRNRLQEIRRLRDRVTREAAAAAPEPRRGGALYAGYGKGARTSLYPEGRGELTGERRAPVVDYETAEVRGEDKMAELFDFSRWTLSS